MSKATWDFLWAFADSALPKRVQCLHDPSTIPGGFLRTSFPQVEPVGLVRPKILARSLRSLRRKCTRRTRGPRTTHANQWFDHPPLSVAGDQTAAREKATRPDQQMPGGAEGPDGRGLTGKSPFRLRGSHRARGRGRREKIIGHAALEKLLFQFTMISRITFVKSHLIVRPFSVIRIRFTDFSFTFRPRVKKKKTGGRWKGKNI